MYAPKLLTLFHFIKRHLKLLHKDSSKHYFCACKINLKFFFLASKIKINSTIKAHSANVTVTPNMRYTPCCACIPTFSTKLCRIELIKDS